MCKGWSWTNDVLIGRHLWPILQQWNGGKGGEEGGVVKEAVLVCVLRLIGMSHDLSQLLERVQNRVVL